tara:strand:- start:310 stop:555 length:246 start_codon:yes stop_codon:yes gene_type:complete
MVMQVHSKQKLNVDKQIVNLIKRKEQMTEIEKLKLHLSNLIEKNESTVVLNTKWLLQILNDYNDQPIEGEVGEVDLDGGQF